MDTVLQTAERLDTTSDPAAAWQVAVDALAEIGVAWCHHTFVASPAGPAARPVAVLRFTSLPIAWQEHHKAEEYWRVDAAVRHCARSVAVMPTGLGFAVSTQDAGWIRMSADAESAGFGDGLAVPLRGSPGTAYGGFSLLTGMRGETFAKWRGAHGRRAVLIAQLSSQRLVALTEASLPKSPRLSPRERECLLWLIAGLRSDRIAERLGLSRVTVDLHLARARRRLGAATREQAVAKALCLGLLDP